MMHILLFIAKYAWIAIIGIILIIFYIIWLIEAIKDILYCYEVFNSPLEHLEDENKIFIAIHVLIPILASFIYFAISNGWFEG